MRADFVDAGLGEELPKSVRLLKVFLYMWDTAVVHPSSPPRFARII